MIRGFWSPLDFFSQTLQSWLHLCSSSFAAAQPLRRQPWPLRPRFWFLRLAFTPVGMFLHPVHAVQPYPLHCLCPFPSVLCSLWCVLRISLWFSVNICSLLFMGSLTPVFVLPGDSCLPDVCSPGWPRTLASGWGLVSVVSRARSRLMWDLWFPVFLFLGGDFPTYTWTWLNPYLQAKGSVTSSPWSTEPPDGRRLFICPPSPLGPVLGLLSLPGFRGLESQLS